MASILQGLSRKCAVHAKEKTLIGLGICACCFVFFVFQALPIFSKHSVTTSPNIAPCTSALKTKEAGQSELFRDVQSFVLFTGHARSGHSIVGAMLDAHPEMVVAHEFNIPQHWAEMETIAKNRRLPMRNVILQKLLESSRNYAVVARNRKGHENGTGSSYNYYIPGQTQGSFKDRIQVIGDKKGTSAANTMLRDPHFFTRLQNIVDVPLRFIQVVRNPFDNIATMLLRNLDSRFQTENKPINEPELLNKAMRAFMRVEGGSEKIRQVYSVLDVQSHDVVLRTKETLQKICNFLQVTCTADYLQACASIVNTQVSVTRNRVVWTDEQKRWLLNDMQKHSYLKHFTYDDYPRL